ncbi:MAG: helix-turn-helix domain-containing protein [Holophaga sp.]|jgi:predicted HTH transcriptional regulator
MNRHEGKTLEFKRDASSPAPLMKTLVAFANGSGGILLIGVEDQTRHILGVPEPTRLEGQLASWIVDRIEPKLVPELLIVPWRNKNLVLVEVFPSPLRPHFLKTEGEANGVYVRIGSTNRKADPAQVAELKRQVLGRSFDEDPLPEKNSDELDFPAASESFAAKRKLVPGDLQTLNLVVRYQNRLVLTVGGLLLFGKERLKVFPDARIRAAVFVGKDRTQILDAQEITSHLPKAVDEVIAFVQRNTRRAIQVAGIRNEGIPGIPLIALREAVINAVVHADYGQHGSPLRVAIFDDRLEIENPGGLPPGLTMDEVRQGASKLRNRVIGRVFHELGLIEQWGSGIQRMTKACLDAGLPEPVLEEIGSGFRVTFGLIPVQKASLELLDQKILDLLEGSTGMSTSQISNEIKRSTRATRDRLKRLVELGLIREYGSSSRDPQKVFKLIGPA